MRRYTGTKRWIGENIVAISGRATARKAVRLWMHSPPHRAILLSPSGRRIGIGKRRGKIGTAPRAVITADLSLTRLSRAAVAAPDSIAPR